MKTEKISFNLIQLIKKAVGSSTYNNSMDLTSNYTAGSVSNRSTSQTSIKSIRPHHQPSWMYRNE